MEKTITLFPEITLIPFLPMKSWLVSKQTGFSRCGIHGSNIAIQSLQRESDNSVKNLPWGYGAPCAILTPSLSFLFFIFSYFYVSTFRQWRPMKTKPTTISLPLSPHLSPHSYPLSNPTNTPYPSFFTPLPFPLPHLNLGIPSIKIQFLYLVHLYNYWIPECS